jgi:hypothetical protein
VWKEATQDNPKPSDKQVKKAVTKVIGKVEATPVPEPPVKTEAQPSAEPENQSTKPATEKPVPVENRSHDHIRKAIRHVDHGSNELEQAAIYGEDLTAIRETLKRVSQRLSFKLKPPNPPLDWGAPRKSKYFEVTNTKIEMGKFRFCRKDKKRAKLSLRTKTKTQRKRNKSKASLRPFFVLSRDSVTQPSMLRTQ